MKHEADELEARLAQLSPGEIDLAWRAEILTHANTNLPAGLSWYFPRPLVASLAACWMMIGVLNVINRSDQPESKLVMPETPSPTTSTASYFESQRKLYAMLSSSKPDISNE